MERDFPQGIDAEYLCTSSDLPPDSGNPEQSDEEIPLRAGQYARFNSLPEFQPYRPGLHKLLKDANPDVVLVPSSPELFLNIMPLACSYAKAVVCAQLGPPLEQLLWKGYFQHLAWFLQPYDTCMMLVHRINNPDPALTVTWLYIFPRRSRHNYITLDIPNSCTYIQCNVDGEIESVS
jgi:hypothetical protein